MAESPFHKMFGIVLKIAQILGFYPSTMISGNGSSLRFSYLQRCKSVSLYIWSFICISINIFVLSYLSVPILALYINMLGLWNSETILGLITSMKPVQSAINLIIFQLGRKNHDAMVRSFVKVEKIFNGDLGVHMPRKIRRKSRSIACLCGFLAGLTLAIRIGEVVTNGETVGNLQLDEFLYVDFSFFLMPMLTLWQMFPLIYFAYVNHLLQYYYRSLAGSMLKWTGAKPLKLYKKLFMALTVTTEKIGFLFNPFTASSLLLVVFNLCLTIYFLVQSNSDLLVNEFTREESLQIIWNAVWGLLQILLFLCYLVIICLVGTRTNEMV